jgi:drug/metabolite transporter (DMT)-like permease
MLGRAAAKLYDNAFVLLTLMALFWAGNQVLGRAVAGHVPPILYSFLRWGLATLIVLPFAARHLVRDWPVLRERWLFLTFLGFTGGGAFNTLQYMGLNHTTALNSLVLNSAGPVLIAIACVVIFGDRLTWRQIAGTIVSMTGVLAIVTHGDPEALATLSFNKGDLLILLAMTISGVYTAYLRLRPPMHWLSFLFAIFLGSAVLNLPLIVWEYVEGARMQVSTFSLLAVGYVAIFPSILAYICFTRGVELIGGVRAGIFLHLIPLFGALMAIGLLGEPLALYHLIGIALILAGVFLASQTAKS